jgi:hypothetical protein
MPCPSKIALESNGQKKLSLFLPGINKTGNNSTVADIQHVKSPWMEREMLHVFKFLQIEPY